MGRQAYVQVQSRVLRLGHICDPYLELLGTNNTIQILTRFKEQLMIPERNI